MWKVLSTPDEKDRARYQPARVHVPPPSNEGKSVGEQVESDEKKYGRRLGDYYLFMEFKKTKHLAPPGVYVLPSADNIRRWHGVIFVHNGYYKNGIYKFIIDIPKDYPKVIPKILFTSKMFHPLINPTTGEVDVSVEFTTWGGHNTFIALLLGYVKKIFYKYDCWKPRVGKNAFNPRAEHLFANDKITFTREASECVRLSQQRQYDNDPDSSIRFKRINAAQIEALRRILAREKVPQGYIAWFADGVNKLIPSRENAPSTVSATPEARAEKTSTTSTTSNK